MDILTLFGFASVSLMLLAYACEERAPAFVLLFAGACCASSIYGFLALQLAFREDGTWIEMGGSAAIKDFLRDEFKVLATA